MTFVTPFSLPKTLSTPLPRQRVFYIGYRYVGPMFCQDIQNLYLKRKGVVGEIRRWAVITYARLDDSDARRYSFQLEECEESLVLRMLRKLDMETDVSIEELRKMGWRGREESSAQIIPLPKLYFERSAKEQ